MQIIALKPAYRLCPFICSFAISSYLLKTEQSTPMTLSSFSFLTLFDIMGFIVNSLFASLSNKKQNRNVIYIRVCERDFQVDNITLTGVLHIDDWYLTCG